MNEEPPFPGQVEERGTYPEPADLSLAVPSIWATVHYVWDIIRPGQIAVMAGEEGTGKSYLAMELSVRLALGEGKLADTWEVVRQGRVLYLSEMSQDQDAARMDRILSSLGRSRLDIIGRLMRLDLDEAASGRPVLQDDGWFTHAMEIAADVHLLVIDTATHAYDSNDWGPDLRKVFWRLRRLLKALPHLSILLTVHLNKPKANGSDVIGLDRVTGHWGRRNDVTLLLGNAGANNEQMTVTARKRLDMERSLIGTKLEGLLVDVTPWMPVQRSGAADAADKLLDSIPFNQDDAISLKALAIQLDMTPQRIGQLVRQLSEAGKVDLTPFVNGKARYVWRVTR